MTSHPEHRTDQATEVATGTTRPAGDPARGGDGAASADTPEHPVDFRLVAVDMDGTLLDEHGEIPASLWPLLERLHERGIAFAPASGRQHATLRAAFGAAGDDMVFIAENGAYVARGDEELSIDVLDPDFVQSTLHLLRGIAADAHRIGVVLCGARSAYIEDADAAFRAEARRYYALLDVVPDLTRVDDRIVKIAVYDFADAETSTYPALAGLADTHQVVVSGAHWIDIMNPGVNKGVALRTLQSVLGVTPQQTAAFGDYLNDLEMLDAAGLSFAMADAHPDVAARARYRAPSFRDAGVITILERMLGAPATR